MISKSSLIKSKKFYEIVFLYCALAGIIAWAAGIVLFGSDGRQFDIFFRNTEDFFADITNVIGYSANRNTYVETYYLGACERAYPAIVYLMAYMLSRIIDMQPYFDNDYFLDMYQDTRILIIIILILIVNMIALYELIRSCKNGNKAVKIMTSIAFCLSMPVIFTIERANFLLMTLFFILFYIFNYDSENKTRRELALISLAMASALKLTPAVLGILLLYNKQWKEAIRTVIYGLILGMVPFLFFHGGLVNIGRMFHNAALNVQAYSSTEGTTIVAALVAFGVNATDGMIKIVKCITYVIVLLLFIQCLFYKEKWEVIMAVSMVLIIAPSHSGYYCIMYLIPAAIAFLNAKEHSYSDLLILFSIILIVMDFQCDLFEYVLNYHLAIMLILAVLLIRGFVRMYDVIKHKSDNSMAK